MASSVEEKPKDKIEERITHENGNGSMLIEKTTESLNDEPTTTDDDTSRNRKILNRNELVEFVRRSGIQTHTVKKSPLLMSLSEPSSPRKLYRPRKNTFNNNEDDEAGDSSDTGSSTTITSEDNLAGSREFNLPKPEGNNVPSLIVSQEEDDTDSWSSSEFRSRTGSHFYHESFNSFPSYSKPSLYLPTNHNNMEQFTFSGKQKKQKGLLNRLRHSFNKHRPVVTDKAQHKNAKQRKWIDHEDELDPVSRPSYFRHIGHVIKAGPGMVQTIQLYRPPLGKFGVYIAQGVDPESNSKSIFVSKFYQEHLSMFYGSLLRPGDEILAVNGQLVRDVPIAKVTKLLTGLETVRLTILPVTATQNVSGPTAGGSQ